MTSSKEGRNEIGHWFGWGLSPPFANPMMTFLADINGACMEALATAQKDWVDFVQQRTREDVTAARRLLNCQSLPDMHQFYSEYWQTAFNQYQEQSEKLAQRGGRIAQHLTETAEESMKEAARVRH